MTTSSRWLRIPGTISLIALLVVTAGCSKQLANLKLSKVSKLLAEAEKFNAATHAKDTLANATRQQQQALQAMASNDFKGARAAANEAALTAREVLAKAKSMEATVQRNAANHEVDIMNYNNGARENPNLFQEILNVQQKMEARYAKEKWVTVIQLAAEIKQKVQQLLLRLSQEADTDLVEVKAEQKRLLDAGGQTYALIYVQRVADLVKQIEDSINPNLTPPIRNYLRAMALSKEALRDAGEGITETKKRICEGKIEIIQNDLIRAKQLNAEVLVPDIWDACSDDFAKLIDNFWKKEYDFVLPAADRLGGQVKQLIYQTRLKSADLAKSNLTQLLAAMRSKGVEDYLPGSLPPIEKMLEEAEAAFKKEDFDVVESTCKQATVQANEIKKNFSVLAEKWIRQGTNIYNRAASVFKEMERIFAEVPLTYTTPLDQKFEENKQAIKTDMAKRLSSAQANLSLAESKQKTEDFRDAIELSRSVGDEATSILATVYNVVAYNVISEIADEVSRYDREGAPEFAATQMAATKKLLQEAIDLRNKGEFQASASKAAESRAQLEATIQTIEVAASQAIEKATAEMKRSDQARTSELRADDYQRAQQYINEARLQLQTTRLIDAIHTAQRAETVVRQAAQDAARLWATQTVKEAQTSLADAKQSGADIYAAQMLSDANEDADQAGKAFASAEDLLGQKKFNEAETKYLEAKTLAIQAAEEARRSKFRNIDEAEATVVEARAYGAWKNQLPALTDAILTLNQAKEAMTAGQFDNSHALARKANEEAKKITDATKADTFRMRLEVVDTLVAEATKSGGRYYEASLLGSLAREIDKMREQYNPELFDSNAKKIAEIETRLQSSIEAMPNVVADWIRRQNERIAQIEKSDVPPTFAPKIAEAKRFFRFADMDFKRGKYRNSYANMLVGRRIIDSLNADKAETAYSRSAREVLDLLKDAMKEFDQYLSLQPKTLMGMTRGAQGERQFIAITGKASPANFRERIDGLMVKVEAIPVPENMKKIHQDMVKMITTARMAAIYYERLMVLSEFDEATKRGIIQKAYDLMETVRKSRGELEQSLMPHSVESQKI